MRSLIASIHRSIEEGFSDLAERRFSDPFGESDDDKANEEREINGSIREACKQIDELCEVIDEYESKMGSPSPPPGPPIPEFSLDDVKTWKDILDARKKLLKSARDRVY